MGNNHITKYKIPLNKRLNRNISDLIQNKKKNKEEEENNISDKKIDIPPVPIKDEIIYKNIISLLNFFYEPDNKSYFSLCEVVFYYDMDESKGERYNIFHKKIINNFKYLSQENESEKKENLNSYKETSQNAESTKEIKIQNEKTTDENKNDIERIKEEEKVNLQISSTSLSKITNKKPKKHLKSPKIAPIVNIRLDMKQLSKEIFLEKLISNNKNKKILTPDKNKKKIINKQILKDIQKISNNNILPNYLNDCNFLKFIDIFTQPNRYENEIIHGMKLRKNKTPEK